MVAPAHRIDPLASLALEIGVRTWRLACHGVRTFYRAQLVGAGVVAAQLGIGAPDAE